MTANGRVEFSGPGVLGHTPALKREKGTILIDASDPDMKRPMPVAITMNLGARFAPTGGFATRRDDIEQFTRILWLREIIHD